MLMFEKWLYNNGFVLGGNNETGKKGKRLETTNKQ